MRTPAQIAGHPIHPMLVTLPIGLWVFSFVCDLIALRSASPETWSTVALYAMVGGCIGGALAAIPGLIDFASLRERDTRRIALTHMLLNVTVLTLFVINAFLRSQGAIDQGVSTGMSAVAVVLLAISGWLGGKMVYVKGVAVNAAPEAASSAADLRSDRGASAERRSSGVGDRRANPDRAFAKDRPGPDTDRT